jgi:hypothetical protein
MENSELNKLKLLLNKIKERTIEALESDIYAIEEKYHNDKWYGTEQYDKDMKKIEELQETIEMLKEA